MRTLWLASILLLTLSACTEKGKPYSVNTPDVRAPAPPDMATAPVDSLQSAQNVSGLSIEELATRILDINKVQAQGTYLSAEAHDELIELNRKILEYPDKASPRFKNLLKRYGDTMLAGCQGFTDGCQSLRFFARAPSSADVAKLIARADANNYFEFILAALRVKSTEWDPEIPEMLLQRPPVATSQAERKYETTVRSLLAVALEQTDEFNQDPQKLRQFLESIHPWKLLIDPEWKADSSARDALIGILAKTHLLNDSQGHLHADLKPWLDSMSADSGSIKAAQNKLNADRLFHLNAAGVQFIDEYNDLNFILDSVFTGRMSGRNAALLFASSSHSADDLEAATQNYLRVQFLSSLRDGTLEAQQIFSAKVRLEDLFEYMRSHSASIQAVWSIFKTRILPVREFALSAARALNGSEAHIQRLTRLFESVDKSILVSSLYPHELVLIYTISQKRFTVNYQDRHHAFYSRSSADMVTDLFNGSLPQLLGYSESEETLNQFDVINAFDIGVRTNLFEAAKINLDDFISDTVTRLGETASSDMNMIIDGINTRYQHSSTYNALAQACSEFTTGRPAPRTIYLGELTSRPYYGNLLLNAFDDLLPMSSNGASTGVSYLTFAYTDSLEEARLDLGNVVRIGQAMLSSYSSYLAKIGLNQMQIAVKTQRSRAALEKIQMSRAKVLAISQTWLKDIGSCVWKMLEREYEVHDQLRQMEMTYLGDIYDKMTLLRQTGGASSLNQPALAASIQFQGLPDGFTGLDRIAHNGYTMSQIDFLLRVRGYLGKIDPHLSVYPGTSFALPNSTILLKSPQQFIPYTSTKDEFVAACMRWLMTKGQISWDPTISFNLYWGNTMKTLASLNRLEYELYGTRQIAPYEAMLDTQERIVKWTNISSGERLLLKLLYKDVKFSDFSKFDFRLLTRDNGEIAEIWGIYDFPYRLMQEPALGFNWHAIESPTVDNVAWARKREDYLKAGRHYFESRAKSHRGLTVLPYNPELDRTQDQIVQQFVRGEMNNTAAFEDALKTRIHQQNQKPAADRPHFDLTTDETYTSLLNPSIASSYHQKLLQFHQDTGGCFTGDQVCNDFK